MGALDRTPCVSRASHVPHLEHQQRGAESNEPPPAPRRFRRLRRLRARMSPRSGTQCRCLCRTPAKHAETSDQFHVVAVSPLQHFPCKSTSAAKANVCSESWFRDIGRQSAAGPIQIASPASVRGRCGYWNQPASALVAEEAFAVSIDGVSDETGFATFSRIGRRGCDRHAGYRSTARAISLVLPVRGADRSDELQLQYLRPMHADSERHWWLLLSEPELRACQRH